jgi:response regulator of citrate/malate metabolism
VLNVNYPGAKTRQLSVRPEQVPHVRKALERYRQVKETLEAISELNQQLLRMDRDESRKEQREA